MRTILKSGAVVAAICLAAAPAVAQSGNASDVTGANITSSAITGGIFTPGGGPPAGGSNNFSTTVGPAVQSSALALSSSFNSGSVSGGGITVSGPGVNAVGAVMNASNTPPAAVVAQVASALSTSGAPAGVVNALLTSIQGLLIAATPVSLTTAVSAFNALVNDASPGFLANPPQEFQAIFAALSNMVSAGNEAAGH